MNRAQGTEVYYLSWRDGEKYVRIICQSKACDFLIQFDFKLDERGQPTDITLLRIMQQYHKMNAHNAEVCEQKDSKTLKSDLIYE